jgi:hypothetical protein
VSLLCVGGVAGGFEGVQGNALEKKNSTSGNMSHI